MKNDLFKLNELIFQTDRNSFVLQKNKTETTKDFVGNENDHYDGFFITYNKENKPIEYLYYSEKNLYLNELEIKNQDFRVVISKLIELDPNLIIEEEGLISLKFQLSIFAPDFYVVLRNYSEEEILEELGDNFIKVENITSFKDKKEFLNKNNKEFFEKIEILIKEIEKE